MKKMLMVCTLALAMSTMTAAQAFAQTAPRARVETHTASYSGTHATLNQKMSLMTGPGTQRYFQPVGTYGSEGERVHVIARAWDPNNGIWWVKVEYPEGTGYTGWTGYKRFASYSFSLDSLPIEVWY